MPPNRLMEEDDDMPKHDHDEKLEERVRTLEASLKAARGAVPLSLIPENGAGEGDEVAETWSLFEQEAARGTAQK